MGVLAVMTLAVLAVWAQQVPATPSLPAADTIGSMTLEAALAARRSVRLFRDMPLSDSQIAQLCWAGQGVTNPQGYRTCPSAGATYPLEMYVVTAKGVARYLPAEHALQQHIAGDRRELLQAAAFGQQCVGQAPGSIVIAAITERTARRYGPRAERYVLMEVGHCAQNILLQAVALGLGSVPVGAFDEGKVAEALQLPSGQQPFYILPVGPRP